MWIEYCAENVKSDNFCYFYSFSMETFGSSFWKFSFTYSSIFLVSECIAFAAEMWSDISLLWFAIQGSNFCVRSLCFVDAFLCSASIWSYLLLSCLYLLENCFSSLQWYLTFLQILTLFYSYDTSTHFTHSPLYGHKPVERLLPSTNAANCCFTSIVVTLAFYYSATGKR